jgi:hypothetical protein
LCSPDRRCWARSFRWPSWSNGCDRRRVSIESATTGRYAHGGGDGAWTLAAAWPSPHLGPELTPREWDLNCGARGHSDLWRGAKTPIGLISKPKSRATGIAVQCVAYRCERPLSSWAPNFRSRPIPVTRAGIRRLMPLTALEGTADVRTAACESKISKAADHRVILQAGIKIPSSVCSSGRRTDTADPSPTLNVLNLSPRSSRSRGPLVPGSGRSARRQAKSARDLM